MNLNMKKFIKRLRELFQRCFAGILPHAFGYKYFDAGAIRRYDSRKHLSELSASRFKWHRLLCFIRTDGCPA